MQLGEMQLVQHLQARLYAKCLSTRSKGLLNAIPQDLYPDQSVCGYDGEPSVTYMSKYFNRGMSWKVFIVVIIVVIVTSRGTWGRV